MKKVQMSVTLRPGTLEDAKRCGEICFRAFIAISEEHNFPPDFPSPEVAVYLACLALAVNQDNFMPLWIKPCQL